MVIPKPYFLTDKGPWHSKSQGGDPCHTHSKSSIVKELFAFYSECFLHSTCFASFMACFRYFVYIYSSLRHFKITAVLQGNYCVIKTFQDHSIGITLFAVLPRLSFLCINCHYQWMFHIIVCIHTLSNFTIFHFLGGIALYVCFMQVNYYLAFIFDFHVKVIYHQGYTECFSATHLDYSLHSTCQTWKQEV